MQDHERLLHFPDLLNARELGGYPTTDGGETRWRSLVRADDLSQLTVEGVRALADYGVGTVIDLRWPEEAALAPSPVPSVLPQVRYQRISLLTHTEDEWRLRGCDADGAARQRLPLRQPQPLGDQPRPGRQGPCARAADRLEHAPFPCRRGGKRVRAAPEVEGAEEFLSLVHALEEEHLGAGVD